MKIDLRGFLVAVNSTNFQSDHFPLLNVQCLIGDVAKLQEFYLVKFDFSLRREFSHFSSGELNLYFHIFHSLLLILQNYNIIYSADY